MGQAQALWAQVLLALHPFPVVTLWLFTFLLLSSQRNDNRVFSRIIFKQWRWDVFVQLCQVYMRSAAVYFYQYLLYANLVCCLNAKHTFVSIPLQAQPNVIIYVVFLTNQVCLSKKWCLCQFFLLNLENLRAGLAVYCTKAWMLLSVHEDGK